MRGEINLGLIAPSSEAHTDQSRQSQTLNAEDNRVNNRKSQTSEVPDRSHINLGLIVQNSET